MYSLLVIIFLRNAVIQAAQVIGENVSVIQGDKAVLPCFLTETTEKLTQITWQRRTRLIKDNTNFYIITASNGPFYFNGDNERFHFVGNIFQRNGSLQLSNATLSDEGTYTCIYTLFPSGNLKTEMQLNVLVPPSEVRIRQISKTSFECVSEANPKANFTWRRCELPWSDSAVKVSGAVLQILDPSPQLNGLFECNATNTYGTNLGYLYLHLSPEGSSAAGWTLFGLLLFINVAVGAFWIYRSDKKCSFPCLNASSDEHRETGTALEPPPPEAQPLNVEESPAHQSVSL